MRGWPKEVIAWLRENVPGRTTKQVTELINQQGFDKKYGMVFSDAVIKNAKNRYGIKRYYRRVSEGVLSKISGRNGKLHSEHCDREKDEEDCRTGVSTFWNRVQREAVQGIQEEPRHHQWR